MNTQHDAYSLFLALREFTLLAFSFSIPGEKLPVMQKCAAAMLNCCRSIHIEEQEKKNQRLIAQGVEEDDLPRIESYKIVPKLHHVQHYSEQIKLFGPISPFSTLQMER